MLDADVCLPRATFTSLALIRVLLRLCDLLRLCERCLWDLCVCDLAERGCRLASPTETKTRNAPRVTRNRRGRRAFLDIMPFPMAPVIQTGMVWTRRVATGRGGFTLPRLPPLRSHTGPRH